MKKRGVSPVIATVLIILITVVVASLVAVFVIPFVKENLKEGEECFDVLGELSFAATSYNCNYINSSAIPQIHRAAFSVRIDGGEIQGFSVVLGKEGSSNSYKIIGGSTFPNIGMLDSNFSLALEVPEEGGVRTYVAADSYTSAELYPVLSNGDI